MPNGAPERVLISGGREVGGLESFATALRGGFVSQNIPTEVVPPGSVMRRWRDLRDARVLKILSTTAAFAAPMARRTICMAHGFPRADAQGWPKAMAVVATHKLANAAAGVQLVAVSHYAAVHLRTIFDVEVDAVVHNPLNPVFLKPCEGEPEERRYITYVGRLIAAKNLHRLLPPVRELLDENPGLRVCVIGDGNRRGELEAMATGDDRFEFAGEREPEFVRNQLRRTRLFFSGCETEALGLAYLEALAQGCAVAMPACGGGLEIAPEQAGRCVHFLPLSFEFREVLATLRRALRSEPGAVDLSGYSADAVAREYLKVDARFDAGGRYRRNPSNRALIGGGVPAAQLLADHGDRGAGFGVLAEAFPTCLAEGNEGGEEKAAENAAQDEENARRE